METSETRSITDSSGYAVFAAGSIGRAHAAAHRFLDAGRPRAGYDYLGRWLRDRTGSGPQWVHVQWHMLVFELSVGRWNAARARFDEHLLPAAVQGDTALTDAPSALWRLNLAARGATRLPWQPIAQRAKALHGSSALVQLHHLLAFAGAQDVDAIQAWKSARSSSRQPADRVLLRFADGLESFALGDHSNAARRLKQGIDGLAQIPGSRAQKALLGCILSEARLESAGGAWPAMTLAA
jgi:hypothetical protein